MSARRVVYCGLAPAAGLSVVILLSGCLPKRIGGSTPADQVIDELRQQSTTQQASIDSLTGELARSRAETQSLRQQLAATCPAIAGVDPAEIPRLAAIQFDYYTGAVDTNGDGLDDTIRIYLLTQDQRGRFLPVAARAVAQAVVIEPGAPARTLAEKSYGPADFNAGYRAGLTGVHYTIDFPLPKSLPAGLKQVTLKMTVTDGATGLTVNAEQPVAVTMSK